MLQCQTDFTFHLHPFPFHVSGKKAGLPRGSLIKCKYFVLTVTGCLKIEAVCRMGGTRDESCFVKSCVPGFASVAVGVGAEDEL